jgi:hypothetical protein
MCDAALSAMRQETRGYYQNNTKIEIIPAKNKGGRTERTARGGNER